ncbi:MAG: SDR family oxidoreductase [Vulcanimicrobiaceae bacterium]|jgi:NAD(P)-dependent dehydrogenase (short-subunit alcohol dehydrogenase family)
MDPSRLDGKVALVTGSSTGIGLASARRMGNLGAKVVVNSRSDERAHAAAATLQSEGITATAAAGDVSTPDGVGRVFERVVADHGTIDILVNNAGQTVVKPSEELTYKEWQHVIAVDLTGPFLCAQAAGRIMLAKGEGVIVNVSSMLSHISLPGRLAYAASKGGVDGITRTLGIEWGRRGVRVVSINPGFVLTALVEGAMRSGRFNKADLEKRSPVGRVAALEEVANVIAFLASPAASYVNATTLLVDGGWTAFGGWT